MYAPRPYFSCLDLRGYRRRGDEYYLRFASEQRCECRTAAFIVDRHDIDSGGGLEEFSGKVGWSTDTAKPEIELPGFGFGQTDQILDGFCRHRRMHGKHQRRDPNKGDR